MGPFLQSIGAFPFPAAMGVRGDRKGCRFSEKALTSPASFPARNDHRAPGGAGGNGKDPRMFRKGPIPRRSYFAGFGYGTERSGAAATGLSAGAGFCSAVGFGSSPGLAAGLGAGLPAG